MAQQGAEHRNIYHLLHKILYFGVHLSYTGIALCYKAFGTLHHVFILLMIIVLKITLLHRTRDGLIKNIVWKFDIYFRQTPPFPSLTQFPFWLQVGQVLMQKYQTIKVLCIICSEDKPFLFRKEGLGWMKKEAAAPQNIYRNRYTR